MSVRRGGLGKGLGALIPTAPVTPASAGPAGAGATALAEAEARPERIGAGAQGGAVSTAPYEVSGVDSGRSPVAGSPDEAPPAGSDQSGPAEVPGASFREVPINQVRPNPKQPRQVFDEDSLEELKVSIREFGLLQPIVVRRLPEPDEYELVMGERRLRAGRDIGLDTIPAIIRETADDAMLRDALLENLHRVQLNPLEEASAYRQLLDDFGTTHEELAQRIGRSRSQVTNTLRLLNLPVAVQRRVAAGVLTAGHARALLALVSTEAQEDLAIRIVAEGLSVRAVEELVSIAAKEAPVKPRATRTTRVTAPRLTDLADRLSDTFDTRVKVELGRRKGKIVVEFASVDDLERIVGMMAPSVGPRGGGEPHDG